MAARRTPEQVHEEDGHPVRVASCSLCTPGPELAPAGEVVLVDEPGPELVAPVGVAEVVPARSRSGECSTPGCTGKGTHGGRCHNCHNDPRRIT